MKLFNKFFYVFTLSIVIISCKDKKDKTPPLPPLVKKEITTSSKKDIPQKGPIINIIDTLEMKRTVMYMKDSAATSAGMSKKLSLIFNKKLPDAIAAAKIKISGEPMAWYKSNKAPFFFEAGIPIDKAPKKLSKGFFIKYTGGDSAFVAHFFGPNEMSNVGYEALLETMKDRNKKKSAAAYEVYINNPFAEKNYNVDRYKLQTNIVMPYK